MDRWSEQRRVPWYAVSVLILILIAMAMGLAGCRSGASTTQPAQPTPPTGPTTALLGQQALFASEATARRLLATDDAFSRSLSSSDRTLRLGLAGDHDAPSFLRHVAKQGRTWSAPGIAVMTATIDRLNAALVGARFPLPKVVPLVRTSGLDEMGAHYTRGSAIMFPGPPMRHPQRRLALLAHELFHVASRHDGAFRRATYALAGAEVLQAPVPVPPSLQGRRVTNPDAPTLDAVVNVVEAGTGQALKVAPVLTLDRDVAEVIGDKQWFRRIQTHLVVVEPTNRAGEVVAPRATDYYARMNRNTTYNIHPEEVLAVNFGLVVLRRAGVNVQLTDQALVDALEGLLFSMEE